jgi:hypothetical protein
MAQFKDHLPTPATLGWIHDLAKAEIHPEAERLLQLGRSYDPQQLIEESSVEFLTALREQFAEYSRLFNAHSSSGTRYQEIKVYNIAQSAADFMVFRNQVKLVVSNSAHGVIQVAFAQHVRGTMSVDGQSHGTSQQPLALPAGLGPVPRRVLDVPGREDHRRPGRQVLLHRVRSRDPRYQALKGGEPAASRSDQSSPPGEGA